MILISLINLIVVCVCSMTRITLDHIIPLQALLRAALASLYILVQITTSFVSHAATDIENQADTTLYARQRMHRKVTLLIDAFSLACLFGFAFPEAFFHSIYRLSLLLQPKPALIKALKSAACSVVI
jgi:hypothetical protein